MLQYVDGDGTTWRTALPHAPMSSRHGSIVGLTPKGENAQRNTPGPGHHRNHLAGEYGADLLDEPGTLEPSSATATRVWRPVSSRPDDWLHRGGYPDGS